MRLKRPIFLIILCTICNISYAKNLTSIDKIQGSKNTSPLIGKRVTIEGIVTADFQSDKSFAGFFVQALQKNEFITSRKSASQGIFVYESQRNVEMGDLVKLSGIVSEHNGVTQISKVKDLRTLKHNHKLPKPYAISLPLKGLDLEKLEGMRVTLDKPAVISDHYNYIKYGEITVSSKLLINPTNSVTPGPQAGFKKERNKNNRLLIDDGSFNKFPNYQDINTQSPVRIGAKVQIVGVMHYAFDSYRVEITEPIKFLKSDFPKQNKPTKIPGHVKIASFNLKNYFTTLDNGKEICGPLKNFGCRGADNKKEFVRQQAKLVNAINTADADIFALQELENNLDSIESLVTALNKDTNKKTWHFIKTGTLGEDVIRVGLIYKTKSISPVGKYKILDPRVNPEFEADKNRDVLLQTFKDSKNHLFNVAVLHLKSKRCTDAVGEDLDQNDGQGCYNASRVKVAQQISDWLDKNPTEQKVESTIIVGDFNAYLKEFPLLTFSNNGYHNLSFKFTDIENWTSIFRGEVGTIDHILVNERANKAAKGMTQWHINTTVSSWFDYNTEDLDKEKPKPRNFYDTSPFASSDHDMVIAGFDFSNN